MRSGFNRAPIVPRREDDGVDSVENAFILRHGTIRIDFRERGRVENPVPNLFPVEFRGR